MMRRSLALRTQILIVLLGGAILPLGLVGVWLTSSARRSGETLLQSQLDQSADRLVSAISGRWRYRLADIALVAGNEASMHVVREGAIDAADSGYLALLANELDATLPGITLLRLDGSVAWSSTRSSRLRERLARGDRGAGQPTETSSAVRFESPVRDHDGRQIGTVIIEVALDALLPGDSARSIVPTAQLAVRETRARERALIPFRNTLPFPDSSRVVIGDTTWLSTSRRIAEPAIEVAVAGRLAPYTEPFVRAASLGVTALVVVALLSLLLVAALATRAMRPLEELAAAAAAVADGRLDHRVATAGPTEVRQLGLAFNVMTDNLRTTLEQLSRKTALAAVGEFATSLSHDVRNGLTAVKVDLDRAARRKIADPLSHDLVARALGNVSRLESTVSGALRIARSGQATMSELDLRSVFEEVATTVGGAFATIPARLVLETGDVPALLHGDDGALQQLFANLLFNAAQALAPGGEARVAVLVTAEAVEVLIADTGSGITPDDLIRLEQPFFTSRRNGTGLGLPIARQICTTHGGTLQVTSEAGRGTVVTVRLPRMNGAFPVKEHDVPESRTTGAVPT